MATTTNFGWETPDDTDLVKDGAAAIRTALNGVDTSFVDLKGGTTGQILSKASGTDLDYTWITPNPGDITSVTAGTGISGGGTSGDVTITNSMATAIDAKGDIIAGTGADAFARLAVGTNGQALIADSTASTGLKWGTVSSGLTLISTTTLSGSSTSINGCFSSTYDNYLIVGYKIKGSTGGDGVAMRLRNAGTDDTSSAYSWYYSDIASGGTPGTQSGVTRWEVGTTNSSYETYFEIGVYNPYNSAATSFGANTTRSGAGRVTMGLNTNNSQYDSFTILPTAGTLTGTVKVYGYAN